MPFLVILWTASVSLNIACLEDIHLFTIY